jgi:putative RecB family exonuclease
VLEDLFGLPAPERTLDRALAMVPTVWDDLVGDDPSLREMFDDAAAVSEWLQSAAPLLQTYFDLEDPTALEPTERELAVQTTLPDGLVLRGIVDRLDTDSEGHTRVVDYKTGRAPGENYEAKALFQMRFYALVLWRSTGVLPTLLQLMYLGDREVLRYRPDEADLQATERKIGALWAAIDRAQQSGDWRPSPSRRCDWCDFRPLCPAHGGTPPPLPSAEPAADSAGAGADPLG